MNQSTFIAGALLAGFVFYLAANNRLNAYAAVLWGATAAPPPASSGSSSGSSSGGLNIGSFFSKALPFIAAAGG